MAWDGLALAWLVDLSVVRRLLLLPELLTRRTNIELLDKAMGEYLGLIEQGY